MTIFDQIVVNSEIKLISVFLSFFNLSFAVPNYSSFETYMNDNKIHMSL